MSKPLNKANTAPGSPATFVLVHGAWHGGWCWKKVKTLLEARGHLVYTPTLTGLGERMHLLHPTIDLNTHIMDIQALLEYEDLQHVILVGHNYAGMVIAGVADVAASRLSQVVYMDAFLPENGKSMKDYLPIATLDEIVKNQGEGWRLPFIGKVEDLGITEVADIAWVDGRVSDHPYKTITERIEFFEEDEDLKKTYIRLSNMPWFTEAAERAANMGITCYEMLEGGHEAMISKPNEVAQLLSELGYH